MSMATELAQIEYGNTAAAGDDPPVTVYVVAGETLLGQYVIAPDVHGQHVYTTAAATLGVLTEVTEVVVTGYTVVERELEGAVQDAARFGAGIASMYLFQYRRDGSWSMVLAPYIEGEGSIIWDDHPFRWTSREPGAGGAEMWNFQVQVFANATRIRVPAMALSVEARYRAAIEQLSDMGMIVDG